MGLSSNLTWNYVIPINVDVVIPICSFMFVGKSKSMDAFVCNDIIGNAAYSEIDYLWGNQIKKLNKFQPVKGKNVK